MPPMYADGYPGGLTTEVAASADSGAAGDAPSPAPSPADHELACLEEPSMAEFPRYLPPGGATDLEHLPHQLEAWDTAMTVFVDAGRQRIAGDLHGQEPAFFDAVHTVSPGTMVEAPITWGGFPRSIAVASPTRAAALAAAETLSSDHAGSFRPQDEYLEWHATTDHTGRITAVDFTCEGPEYWEALAHGYPDALDARREPHWPDAHGSTDRLLALYRTYVSPDVQLADLLGADGRYDGRNPWNTERGAMHLTHPSNSLVAEVFLAADATVLREKHGHPVTNADALILCARYGEPARASDPTIGASVNALVRSGHRVSLKNPVGLYIDGFDATGVAKPDGTPADNYLTVLRGASDAILRARFEVPASEGFAVSDLTIAGEPIRFAGQLAERITMKLTGVAVAGFTPAPAVGCAPSAARTSLSTHASVAPAPDEGARATPEVVHGPQQTVPLAQALAELQGRSWR